MKVKVTLTSTDGVEWVAECKDIGLTTTAASMLSALEEMYDEIRKFFAKSFGSNKEIETFCSKIKATASVTVSPLDPRPETPLTSFEPADPLLIEGQDLIEGQEQLALPPGEEEIEIDGGDELPPEDSDMIIDAEVTPVGEIA